MKHLGLALLLLGFAGCPGETSMPDPTPTLDGGVDETCTPAVTPGTPLRLLTRAEYALTIRDLLGLEAEVTADFPREALSHGLDNDADLNTATEAHVAAYLSGAETLASRAVSTRQAALAPCGERDQACGERFIATTGLRAFRRPLTVEERTTLNSLFATSLAAESFDGALELSLQAMLQSPQFLYRDEQALAPVPQPVVALSGFELASRLSYFLWGSMPDDALLEAAANGVLDTPEGLTAQATRMLEDPKSLDGQLRFFSLWLAFDQIENTEKSLPAYPEFTPALARAWRQSLELYVRDVLTHDGTLSSLLTSNVLFTNDAMSMYGPAAPSSAFVRNEMSGSQRRGLLTQPGFLASKAMPDGSSPVRRGIFVLDQLLCEVPPPPPAAFTPPQPSTTVTTRERFAAHSQSAGCKGCHQYIDPVGFTFEHYDGLGRWRDTENGQPINAKGGVLKSEHSELLGEVDGAGALSEKLAQSPAVQSCVAKAVYRFALGRALTQADTCTVAQISNRFSTSGGSFKALALAIVQSDAFRKNVNPEMTP